MIVDAINELKLSVINDFRNYLDYAGIGIKQDYSMILHKIVFVESYSHLDKINSTYQFLKNN